MASVYSVCGLDLVSEPPLPALEARLREGAADPARRVTFRVADVSAPPAPTWIVVRTFEGDERPWLSVGRFAGGHLLRVHDEADFVVSPGGDEITCSPGPGCPMASVEQLLLDQILPQVLHFRGQPCFHASAVAAADGGVIAFAGVSGMGKSTLAASFAGSAAGARALVSDDCLVASIEGAGALVHPSYPSVRLCEDAAEALCGSAAGLSPAAPRTDKLRVGFAGVDREARPLLRRIYLLERGEGAPTLSRLGPRDAIVRLADHLHRLDPGDRRRLAQELAYLEALVQRVPVARLTYPRSYGELARVRALIDADQAALA